MIIFSQAIQFMPFLRSMDIKCQFSIFHFISIMKGHNIGIIFIKHSQMHVTCTCNNAFNFIQI